MASYTSYEHVREFKDALGRRYSITIHDGVIIKLSRWSLLHADFRHVKHLTQAELKRMLRQAEETEDILEKASNSPMPFFLTLPK